MNRESSESNDGDGSRSAAADIVIRKMRAADEADALALLARWNLMPTPASASRPDPERSALSVENGFVAVRDGVVVGVCSYILHGSERAETASLAVDPSLRGSGTGERLQRARLEEMKARGIRTVFTEADRPEVIAWYVRKFGYRVAGTNPKKHAFGLDSVDHWTLLELDLS